MRVLLRARNSLRSFRCRARKPGPCRARARHFAFSETGQAGHTQYVCCFAPEIRCAHFGAALANPALAGLRPSFRFQRNRAGRSHAGRVLLRAQNSLRSFRGPARKPGPCRACARHFAFSETGQAGHTLGVCCFAPKIRCAHFGAPLANPAPSVPLKNTNSNANNWRICVFLNASLRWPRTPACGPRAGLRPVGLGTRLRAQNGKQGGVFRARAKQ